jgi:hypothetical protein
MYTKKWMFFEGKQGGDRARESREAREGEMEPKGRGEQRGGQAAMKRPFEAWLKEDRRAHNNWVQGGQNTQDSNIGKHVNNIANISKLDI